MPTIPSNADLGRQLLKNIVIMMLVKWTIIIGLNHWAKKVLAKP